MTITLYTSTAEKIRVDKTSYLTQRSVLSGTLKNETSILRPSILIEAASVNANYMYIGEFSRYYFITNITSISSFLWQIDGVVDPLMSFKGTKNGSASTGIYSLYAFVSRSESKSNDALTDSAYPVETVSHVNHVNGTLNTGSAWFGSSAFLQGEDTYRYIMQYNGGMTSTGMTNTYPYPLQTVVLDYVAVSKLIAQLTQSTTLSSANKTVLDYIYAFYCLPVSPVNYNLTTNSADVTLHFPGWGHDITIPGSGGTQVGYARKETFLPKDTYFKITFATPSTSLRYLNYRPYAQYFIKFTPFGKIELDPNVIFNPAASLPTTQLFICA